MRSIKGNVISQYAIIIGIVIIALIPIFYVFGSTITKSFTDFYNCLQNKEEIATTSTSNAVQDNNTGSSGTGTSNNDTSAGTSTDMNTTTTPAPDTPVSNCSGGVCDIDFGDFVLSGIPENFGGFIEAQGTSGGTDKIVTLLKQIAEQLKEQGDMEGYQQYMDLANLGHFMARLEEQMTEKAVMCDNLGSSVPCLHEVSSTYAPIEINSEFRRILPDYDYMRNLFSGMLNDSTYNYMSIGYAQAQADGNGGIIPNTDRFPGAAMAKIYNEIMDNPNYSDSLKGMTSELVQFIEDLSYNQMGYYNSLYFTDAFTEIDAPFSLYDVTDGSIIKTEKFQYDQIITAVMDPNISTGTDLNSALICASGNNHDTGKRCH